VAYQARLESVCSRKVTVGSNPTLSASLRHVKTKTENSKVKTITKKNKLK
jgi:hypothetical protein